MIWKRFCQSSQAGLVNKNKQARHRKIWWNDNFNYKVSEKYRLRLHWNYDAISIGLIGLVSDFVNLAGWELSTVVKCYKEKGDTLEKGICGVLK